MLDFLLKIFGDPNEKKIKHMMGIVEHINALEPQFSMLSDEELRAKTDEFKAILAKRPTSKDFKTDRKLEKEALDKIAPMGAEYHHDEFWHVGNGYAHIRAALVGSSVNIALKDGLLNLGTWQQVVLLDFDNKQRSRNITVQIIC